MIKELAPIDKRMLSPFLRGSRPSFVLFNVDDTGYGDWSWNSDVPGGDEDNTPRTAALRKRGLRLTDLHAGSSARSHTVGPLSPLSPSHRLFRGQSRLA